MNSVSSLAACSKASKQAPRLSVRIATWSGSPAPACRAARSFSGVRGSSSSAAQTASKRCPKPRHFSLPKAPSSPLPRSGCGPLSSPEGLAASAAASPCSPGRAKASARRLAAGSASASAAWNSSRRSPGRSRGACVAICRQAPSVSPIISAQRRSSSAVPGGGRPSPAAPARRGARQRASATTLARPRRRLRVERGARRRWASRRNDRRAMALRRAWHPVVGLAEPMNYTMKRLSSCSLSGSFIFD